MSKNFIVKGAQLVCDKGSAPATLKVTSKGIRFSNKEVATDKDKEIEGNFGSCAMCNNNPCAARLLQWKITTQKINENRGNLLTEGSYIECANGGIVTIKNPNQQAAALGKTTGDLDKYYPKLQGDVIFVNGFHSDFPENSGQVIWDAIFGLIHEERDFLSSQDEGVNERNPKEEYPEDMFANREVKNYPIEGVSEEKLERIMKNGTLNSNDEPNSALLNFKTKLEKFWHYWNTTTNGYEFSKTFCDYFNASGHDHYINGSHGLGSNGAHRIDHGIALGYAWAKDNWDIYPKKYIEERPDDIYLKSYTPAYKPITVVGHSQGAAMGTGVALGIMYYAKELGWEKIALNIIYLGVHQPQGLYGEKYENLIRDKVDFYEVDFNQMNSEEEGGGKILNKLGSFFSTKYHKLLNERGIYEHLVETLGDKGWNEYKKHCVQFTFTNDRADFVILDGDIPEIKNACDPEGNEDPFHLHCFLSNRKSLNAGTPFSDQRNPKMECLFSSSDQAKIEAPYEPIKAKWYQYMVNRLFEPVALDRKEKKQRKDGALWKVVEKDKNNEDIIKKYIQDFDNFLSYRKMYQRVHKRKFVEEVRVDCQHWNFTPEGIIYYDDSEEGEKFSQKKIPSSKITVSPIDFFTDEYYAYVVTYIHYQKFKQSYAALQGTQLYAHFAPVAFINHDEILSDFPNDIYGKISIFDRICKAGEDIFYRLVTPKGSDEENISNGTKIEDFEEKLREIRNKMINVNIVDNSYIDQVIKAYLKIENKREARKAREELYHEPKYKKKSK